MRLQRDRQPPRYLGRRDQWRMLALVALFGMVLLCYRSARDPRNWDWFAALSQPPSDESTEDSENLNFTVRPLSISDELRISLATDDPKSLDVDDPTDPSALPPELFNDVHDNQLGTTRPEQDAITTILDKVRTLSSEQLDVEAMKDVVHASLIQDPDNYRGRLITLRGTLWRYGPAARGDPDDSTDDVYEAWMFTSDSGNRPYRWLLVEPVSGVSPGDQLDVEVEVTGYFVKRYAYLTGDGTNVAPMLVGRTMRVVRTAPVALPESDSGLGRLALWFFIVLGLAFAGLLLRFVISDRRYRAGRLHQLADARLDAHPEDIAALEDLETVDPGTMFASQDSHADS